MAFFWVGVGFAVGTYGLVFLFLLPFFTANAVIMSYVVSDIILNFFINGGQGYAKIFTQNEFAYKGYAYIAFLVGIVLGTVVSTLT